jgi:presenilin-like A22 family membrane protease
MPSLRSLGLVGLYLGAQFLALLLAVPFRSEGLQTTSNPTSPTAALYLIVVIVAAPVAILLLARLRGALNALRWVILVGIAGSLMITLPAAFAAIYPNWFYVPSSAAGIPFVAPIFPAALLGIIIAVLLFEALLLEPQWYVVDLAGLFAGGALIALFGISFAILPVFILLIILAVYDAIAVYGTKHMVSLAEVVTDLKLPILMVVPSDAGYDYTQNKGFVAERSRPVEEREAMFMGLGDVVFPGILVVSAYIWLAPIPVLLGVGANIWIALGSLLGSLAGYALLMRFVRSGNPQAGLPFLNGGALAGFILTYLLVVHNAGFGFSFQF